MKLKIFTKKEWSIYKDKKRNQIAEAQKLGWRDAHDQLQRKIDILAATLWATVREVRPDSTRSTVHMDLIGRIEARLHYDTMGNPSVELFEKNLLP